MRLLLLTLGLLALTGIGRAAAPFSYRDDFSHYPAGSDGAPGWSTGAIGWEMGHGAFICTERAKETALLAAAPVGNTVTVEADLTMQQTTDNGWKIAGLCIQQDAGHFWHLALVEEPDANGKHHFVELSEMYAGNWLAQWVKETRLTQQTNQGGSLNWAYHHRYHLVLAMTPAGITGQVQEPDGTVSAKISFVFDGHAVTSGKPGLTAGGFTAEFTAFSTQVDGAVAGATPANTPPPAYVAAGGKQHRLGKATGYFHLEKAGKTWWMADPAGNATFIIGTDHANYNAHWCEKLGYAPYHRNCAQQYGSEEKWADSTVKRLTAWGFNSVGVGSSPSVRHRGLAHCDMLDLGTGFTRYDAITPRTTWTGFPNVFSPQFPRYCEKQAQHQCTPADPWLVGYFIDNELEWRPWTGGGPFADTFKKPAENSAKQALVELLTARHKTPEEFNQAWGTHITRFDELGALTTAPQVATPAAQADERAFVRLVAEKYFSITSAAIRKYDPHHLVMGCRFAGWAPDVMDIAGKYCDVISVNCYRTLNLETGAMTDGFAEELAGWYAKAGKPIIITEWSFPALDAGLPCNHGAGQRVPTQKDRAFAFTAFQKLLFATPYVIGSDYFMWADEPALGISSTFPEDSNYGLVNEHDTPYSLLTQAATALHAQVYAIHAGKVADLAVQPGSGHGSFVLRNSGGAPGAYTVTLWVDGAVQTKLLDVPAGATREISAPPAALAAPGGHFLCCRAVAEQPLLEKGAAVHEAACTNYVPGAPWRAQSNGRTPVLVANPGDRALDNVVVAMKAADIFPAKVASLTVIDATTGKPIPAQLDTLEGGTELAFRVDGLAPHGGKTFFVYPEDTAVAATAAVNYQQAGKGFTVDNGTLTLANSAGSGNTFDRISLRGVELGRFTPLAWQEVGQSLWVAPNAVEQVQVANGPVRLVLEITAVRDGAGGTTITRVDTTGKPAAAERREMRYRTKFRYVIEPGRPWFTSRLLWLENSDTQPWQLGGYYHYLPSNIAGKSADDEARGTYWHNAAAGINFGILPTPPITVSFWKDSAGGEHPDALRKVNLTLQPGKRFAGDEPVAYVIGEQEANWQASLRLLADQGQVAWQAGKVERR